MNKTPEPVESTELLPCPFCGGNNVKQVDCCVSCFDCGGAASWARTDSEGLEFWNRRAHPLPSPQVTRGQQGALSDLARELDAWVSAAKNVGSHKEYIRGLGFAAYLARHPESWDEPPPETGTPMGESPAQMVMVPRETVERAAQWLECAADSGVQAEYEDGTDTPNRIGLRKACNDLRAAAHEAQRGKACS